jgi:hypothetical protein
MPSNAGGILCKRNRSRRGVNILFASIIKAIKGKEKEIVLYKWEKGKLVEVLK